METQPDMPVMDAAITSSSIPPMYQPRVHNGRFFFDGGFTNNFAVEECIKKHDAADVLAVRNDYRHLTPKFETASAISIISHVTELLVLRANKHEENMAAAKQCKYLVSYSGNSMTEPALWHQFLRSSESRRTLFEAGRAAAVAVFTEAERC
jgi:predicted acylesterase/phospholipase RssA